MAGKKGRSGRPRKDIQVHLLNGTYRRDRHGPIPPGLSRGVVPFAAVTAVALQPGVPEVPVWLTAGLGPDGHRLVTTLWGQYEFSLAEAELLRQCARALDLAETVPPGQLQIAAAKQFTGLLADLTKETR